VEREESQKEGDKAAERKRTQGEIQRERKIERKGRAVGAGPAAHGSQSHTPTALPGCNWCGTTGTRGHQRNHANQGQPGKHGNQGRRRELGAKNRSRGDWTNFGGIQGELGVVSGSRSHMGTSGHLVNQSPPGQPVAVWGTGTIRGTTGTDQETNGNKKKLG
jgi:hypothetical protein